MDSLSIYNDYFNNEEYHSSKRFKLSQDVIDDASSNQEIKKSTIIDNFCGMESSSCDSYSNEALEINYTEISSSQSISWRKEKSSNMIQFISYGNLCI